MRTRVGFVVAVLGACGVLAVPAAADAAPGHKRALAQSAKNPPSIKDGRLTRSSAKRVAFRFRVRLPKVGTRHEHARAEISAFGSGHSLVPIWTTRRRVSTRGDRSSRMKVVIGGKAGKLLARAIRQGRGGPRGPLNLVSVAIHHRRDLYGDKGIDATWRFTARGKLLHAKSQRRPRSGASALAAQRLGSSQFVLSFNIGADEITPISVGDLTCSTGAGGANKAWIGPGSGNGNVFHVNVAEKSSGTVSGTNGVGNNPANASGLFNAEARAFAFEASVKWDAPLVAPPSQFNHALVDKLPRRDALCSSGTHSFIVASDGVRSGDHSAVVYQYGRTWAGADIDVKVFDDGELSETGVGQSLSKEDGHWMITIGGNGDGHPTLPGPGPCTDATAWLECKFPPGNPQKSSTPLYDVVIPGSHDSATSMVGLALDSSSASIPNCSAGPGPGGLLQKFPTVTRNWAVTQPLNLREQLEAGIRYLDLRLAWDGTQFRPLHTMWSYDDLVRTQQMIADWAARHPDEIVIADFNHICGIDSTNVSSLEAALSEPAPYTGNSLCKQAYPILSPTQAVASDLASRTVGDIRAGKGNVIVLLQDTGSLYQQSAKCGWAQEAKPDYTTSPAILPMYVPIYGAWPNVEGPPPDVPSGGFSACALPSLADQINHYINDYPKTGDPLTKGVDSLLDHYKTLNPKPLLQTQMLYTLRFGDTVDDTISGSLVADLVCPNSLRKWEWALTSLGSDYARDDILADWGTRTNLVIADDVTLDGYIAQAVNLNPNP